MKKMLTAIFLAAALTSTAQAGGTPEYVKLPANYKHTDTNYMTQNSIVEEQVTKIYAPDSLLNAVASGEPVADGATIVMEMYEPKRDGNKRPINETGSQFKIDHLAAIAVMEYRQDWPSELPSNERAGNWAFALYTADGKPKQNDSNCVACHQQLSRVNYMFTTVLMKNHVHGQQQ